MKDTSYIGTWMRYEAGNCTIAISMKRPFKRCPKKWILMLVTFLPKIALKQRLSIVFHDLGSKFNLQQNGHHLNAPFMLITMVQIPPQYLILSPRYPWLIYLHTPCIQCQVKDTSYLGMWIRYEAGNTAIVISMKRAFKRRPKRMCNTVFMDSQFLMKQQSQNSSLLL